MSSSAWSIAARWPGGISRLPAEALWLRGASPVPGHRVAEAYGLLAHYCTRGTLEWIGRAGAVGTDRGCWLTPSAYAACMAPYDLGLGSAVDVCLLVDVSELAALWGPGTAPASATYASVWRGDAIEFFSPTPVPFSRVRRIVAVLPCGDTHRNGIG